MASVAQRSVFQPSGLEEGCGYDGDLRVGPCVRWAVGEVRRCNSSASVLPPAGTLSLSIPVNWPLWDAGFTSKERDAETGLDYFGARYFSAAQGRFTSPDPPILDQHIEDPQSWNLYAYARNNPLRFVDPNGNAVELLGDEEQRKKELALLQSQMGNKKASAALYINEVKDGDKTRYFVGIKGDVGDFMKLSSASHDLANVVQDKNVVEFGLTSRSLAQWGGAVTFEKGETAQYGMPANQNVQVLVNPNQMNIANQRLMTPNLLGAARFEGQFQSPPWHINDYTLGLASFHEFGHAWGFIHGRTGMQTNREAIDWENRLREQLYGPLGRYNARRIAH